jgi:hypothetical protein
VEQVNAQGKPVHVEYSAKYDGEDYPETGSPAGDTIALKRINANTLETTAKKDGKVVATSRVVISKDGKTRTNTFKGKSKEGEPISWTVAFDGQ